MNTKPPRYSHRFIFPWNDVNIMFFCISNFFLPCIILKRSLVQVNFIILFFSKQIIHYRTNFFFYCLWEYYQNDVFKHQTTRHKTPGIIIAQVLKFDWKNTIFRVNFLFLMRIIIHCQKLEMLTSFFPFS